VAQRPAAAAVTFHAAEPAVAFFLGTTNAIIVLRLLTRAVLNRNPDRQEGEQTNLFLSQGDQWIYARRSPGWNIARRQRHYAENRRNSQIGQRIGRLHFE
jgi:hypothetical protein